MNYTSKRKFISDSKVDRRFLAHYVSNKLNKSIALYHIIAVIDLLIEELLLDLKNNCVINIGNLGKFFIKKTNPRRHYNVVTKKITFTKGSEILRFSLNKNFRKILTKNLDIAKTFKES